MNERFQDMNDAALENALRGLDTSRMFPPAPDFAARVGDRLRVEPSEVEPAPANVVPMRRRLGIVAAIAVLAVGAALLAVPTSRDTVAGWFGLRSVSVVPVTATPELPVTPVRLDVGSPLPLERAQRIVEFDILVPDLEWLGEPDETYYQDWPPGGQVALVYQNRPGGLPESNLAGVGLLITQFEADLNVGGYGKGIPQGTTIEEVIVNGGHGIWIEGDLHTFFYTDREGNPGNERIRLAGNVLVWEVGDVTYRIESSLPRERVFQIAESLVPFQSQGEQ